MNTKHGLAGMLLLVLVSAPAAVANNAYFGDVGGNHLWRNNANWNNAYGPVAGDNAYNDVDYLATGKYVWIDAATTAEAEQYHTGNNVANCNTRLLMTGGTFDLTGSLQIRQGHGHVFDMEGGKVTVGTLFALRSYSGAGGTLNLTGGEIYTDTFILKIATSTGTVSITEGALYIKGDVRATIEGHVTNDHAISGYGQCVVSDGKHAGVKMELVTVETVTYTKVSGVPEPIPLGTTILVR